MLENDFAETLGGSLATGKCKFEVRTTAWSKTKPGLGFGLKKQMPSDCDLRNLSKVDDGAGACSVARIATGEAATVILGIPVHNVLDLGSRNI